MKILKILIISIVILTVVIILAGVILVKTFDVNRFKPQILSQASAALNRQVNFEKAKLILSLTDGISLKIENLVIAEDPVFGQGDFITVKEISLAVDVLGYLFQKKVKVPGIRVDSPRLTIIRQKNGSLNVLSLAQSAKINKASLKSAAASAPLVIPAILISSLRLENGTVRYIDRSFEPEVRLDVSDLNILVSKISLNQPFPFVVTAAVLSADQNIRLEGKAQLDLKTNQVTISELKGATELSELLLEKIPVSFPMTKGVILPKSLKGKVEVTLKKLTAGTNGFTALPINAGLTNGSLQFKELALPIKDVKIDARITARKIILDKAAASIGEGTLNASGVIDDYSGRQGFSFEANAKNLKVEKLLVPDKSALKVEGLASAKIRLQGEGFSPQALRSNLSGDAEISLSKGKLKDVNVLRAVLDKISVIPGLSQRIEAGLPQRYSQKLAQRDTLLGEIKLPVEIVNAQLIVKEAVLQADEFLFKGSGVAGFNGAYSLEGSFFIPQELSASMVAAVSQLQYLLNDERQIYIPLKIAGQATEMKFEVDTEYIAQKLLETQARQQIFKAIDKALGGKGEDAAGQNAQPAGSGEKSNVEKTVGSILGNILKGK